jgi:xanthine dehydrogenase accessory factor
MQDILPDISRWLERGEPVALATVVQTWGSSPRAAGAKMAMTPGGGMTGSVSGGCVEGATFEEGVATLKTGHGKLVHFGVADETAWEVGLACGGSIDVLVQPLDRERFERVRDLIEAERLFAIVSLVKGPADQIGQGFVLEEAGEIVGRLPATWHDQAVEAAQAALAAGQSRRQALGEVEVFIEVVWPAPTVIAVGGVHTSIALMALAKTLGYKTVVVDPRKAFGSQERFPHVDRLIQAWPDDALRQLTLNRATAIALLTHDPKLDDPGLHVALNSPAFYIGALGSKSTQQKRRDRLKAEGFSDAQLARIRGPIGLPLGGRTPEEVALAILAEIVAARNNRPVVQSSTTRLLDDY